MTGASTVHKRIVGQDGFEIQHVVRGTGGRLPTGSVGIGHDSARGGGAKGKGDTESRDRGDCSAHDGVLSVQDVTRWWRRASESVLDVNPATTNRPWCCDALSPVREVGKAVFWIYAWQASSGQEFHRPKHGRKSRKAAEQEMGNPRTGTLSACHGGHFLLSCFPALLLSHRSYQVTDSSHSPPNLEQSGARHRRSWSDPVFLSIVLAAALVRVPGCFTELWLDEVIYVALANDQIRSPIDVFTVDQDWANQHLSTMIFYALGQRDHWFVYRIPSLIGGVGTVILAWLIAARAGRGAAIIAALLSGGSYLLIHYSSEARGYALVVLFAFASWYALQRFSDRKRWFWIFVFWICACLGFLSHLMYVHILTASAVWLVHHLHRTSRSRIECIARCLQCLAVPSIFLVVYWVFVVRHLEIFGSGLERRLSDVLVQTLSYGSGGPAEGSLALAVAVLVACGFVGAIVLMVREKRDDWSFYLTAVVVSPAVLLLVRPPDLIVVRYFLVQVAFALVALSFALAQLGRSGHLARLAVVLAMLLSLVGNGLNVSTFFRYGRGSYLRGLRYIVQQTSGNTVTIASDHDDRNGLLVDYYRRFLPQGRRIIYIDREDYPLTGSLWMIHHRIGDPGEVPLIWVDAHGNRFELAVSMPYSDLSGWHWFLYKRQF